MEPANTIIRSLGGAIAVAGFLGLHRTRVSSWRLPRAKGGTDGQIPFRHIHKLLAHAKDRGVRLEPADFILVPPGGPLADPDISSLPCSVAGQEGTTNDQSETANLGAKNASAHG